jgi:hypothetical protein
MEVLGVFFVMLMLPDVAAVSVKELIPPKA